MPKNELEATEQNGKLLADPVGFYDQPSA
uniref:Aldo/keto reductase n=2 Tax=Bursaphelenchus xylophilus TaxID=6326 RepID=A0A1I7SHY3_BURXY